MWEIRAQMRPLCFNFGVKGLGACPRWMSEVTLWSPLRRLAGWQSNQPNVTCVLEAVERALGLERPRASDGADGAHVGPQTRRIGGTAAEAREAQLPGGPLGPSQCTAGGCWAGPGGCVTQSHPTPTWNGSS